MIKNHENKFVVILFILLFQITIINAQQNKIIPCYTDEILQEMITKDPSVLEKKLNYENYIQSFSSHKSVNKMAAGPRIIPVVFHVIHEGGPENISKAQIEDQIRILNEDYRRKNLDAANTPGPFAAVAADCDIEFRLAQKDPNGNCTEGIVRIYSPLTNGLLKDREQVKALSHWPSDQYLNIWVVKNIYDDTPNSSILGYATFPFLFPAFPNLDGLVLRSDVVGSIGTAVVGQSAFPESKGRTATHEIGHWLGLRHIWGDQTCGDDGTSDTPQHKEANTGNITLFPYHLDLCPIKNSPNGEMYMNYMDYTDGNRQNLFTAEQKTKWMDGTLAGIRSNTISATNLANTGTDGSPAVPCTPIAEFSPYSIKMICQGGTVSFTDDSYNGTAASWEWAFPGGTPPTSTAQNPTVTYSNSGTYSVTLKINNSNSITKTNLVYVSSNTASFANSVYAESFENMPISDNNWMVVNPLGATWEKTTTAAYTGNASIKLDNTNSNIGDIDELISPSIDLTKIANPKLYYKVAYAQKTTSTATQNKLQVFISTNCGTSWITKSTKMGAVLANAPPTDNPFTPANASEWRQDSVSLASYATKDNIRIKFRFTAEGGNNIYLDDVNIGSPFASGVAETPWIPDLKFNIFPNPAKDNATISFYLNQKEKVELSLYDLLGREIKTLYKGLSQAGEQHIDVSSSNIKNAGIYLVKINVADRIYVRKLLFQ